MSLAFQLQLINKDKRTHPSCPRPLKEPFDTHRPSERSFGRSTEVSKPFVYFVPEKCIADPTGDSVHLSAAFVDGSPLPSWLTFDGSAFRGAFDANRFAGNGRKRRESKEGDPGARGAWARGRVARRKEERDHGAFTKSHLELGGLARPIQLSGCDSKGTPILSSVRNRHPYQDLIGDSWSYDFGWCRGGF